MKFFDNILITYKKGLNFSGRATIKEFWSLFLFEIILFYFTKLLFLYLDEISQKEGLDFLLFIFYGIISIFYLILYLFFLAVLCRRFNDAGFPRVMVFIPSIFCVILLILYFKSDGKSLIFSNSVYLICVSFLIFFLNFFLLMIALSPSKIDINKENKIDKT